MKPKFKKIADTIVKWLGIVFVIAILAAITFSIGMWMKDKLWFLLVLDTMFCACLWGLFKIKNSSKKIIHVGLLACMLLVFIVLGSATLALLDILWVRVNIMVFISMILGTLVVQK